MNLIFDRGDRDAPVGHALIYFRANDGTVLASYVSVPPIPFDLSKFMPGFMSQALQGVDFSGAGIVSPPMPPAAEEVESLEYLQALAERRHDDLVFAGGTMREDTMRLMAETQEAARLYGELYEAVPRPDVGSSVTPAPNADLARYQAMTDLEKINELNGLTGRLRDTLRFGQPDEEIVHTMEAIASLLPAKYRAQDLPSVASTPGDVGQHLAELYLERSYKLYREEYLDLERIDREIEAARAQL